MSSPFLSKRRRSSIISFCQQISKTSVIEPKITQIISELSKYPDNLARHKQLFTDNSIFEVIVYILSKPNRNENDITIISLYLRTLTEFIKILNTNNSIDTNVLLTNISLQLKCEKSLKDTILFKCGDKGNKYYIILKGTVSVMIPKEIQICLNLIDYIKYLIRLLLIKDKELLNRTLTANKNIYYITEQELDIFYENYIDNQEEHDAKQSNNDDSINIKEYECLPEYSILSKLEMIDILKIISYSKKVRQEINKLSTLNTISFKEKFISLTYNNNDFINQKGQPTVTIFDYFEVIQLTQSNSFGEIALQSQNSKRSATIICLEECVFGTLSCDAYSSSIKDIQTKNRRNNIKFLLSFNFFAKLGWMFFETRFFNYFTIQTVHSGEYLLTQGKHSDYVYFVKEGEFEVTTKLNEIELEKHMEFIGHIKKLYITNHQYAYTDRITRKMFRIAIFKDNDVIGLEDMFNENKICLFNVKCISEKGSIFTIERKIMESIINKIKEVSEQFKKYSNLRKKMMFERLNILLKIKYESELSKNGSNLSDSETNNCSSSNIKHKFTKSFSFTDIISQAQSKKMSLFKKEKKSNKVVININKIEPKHKSTSSNLTSVVAQNESPTKQKSSPKTITSSLFTYRSNRVPQINANSSPNSKTTFQQFHNNCSNLINNIKSSNSIIVQKNVTPLNSISKPLNQGKHTSQSMQTTLSSFNKRNCFHSRISSPVNINNPKEFGVKKVHLNTNNKNNNLLNKLLAKPNNNKQINLTYKGIIHHYKKSNELLSKDNESFEASKRDTPIIKNGFSVVDLLQFETYGIKEQGNVIASARICKKYGKKRSLQHKYRKHKTYLYGNNNIPVCIKLNK